MILWPTNGNIAMYVRREIIVNVINLFKANPKMRDNRIATIECLVEKHYAEWFGKNVKASAILVMDIDRAFRLVQQYTPDLRGKNWLKRQKQSGEITADEYKKAMRTIGYIKSITSQLKLTFEEGAKSQIDFEFHP
jgi:hypothetical protein